MADYSYTRAGETIDDDERQRRRHCSNLLADLVTHQLGRCPSANTDCLGISSTDASTKQGIIHAVGCTSNIVATDAIINLPSSQSFDSAAQESIANSCDIRGDKLETDKQLAQLQETKSPTIFIGDNGNGLEDSEPGKERIDDATITVSEWIENLTYLIDALRLKRRGACVWAPDALHLRRQVVAFTSHYPPPNDPVSIEAKQKYFRKCNDFCSKSCVMSSFVHQGIDPCINPVLSPGDGFTFPDTTRELTLAWIDKVHSMDQTSREWMFWEPTEFHRGTDLRWMMFYLIHLRYHNPGVGYRIDRNSTYYGWLQKQRLYLQNQSLSPIRILALDRVGLGWRTRSQSLRDVYDVS
ncbi:hypothetical protein MPSEU_000230300 [Mayamaea pseudoterrestris]|nr:hypothetical protein MPSEU_000230300 [Mayamaea pseudoterrestris]